MAMGGQEKKVSVVLFQACVVFLLAKQCVVRMPILCSRKVGVQSKRKMFREESRGRPSLYSRTKAGATLYWLALC